MSFDLFSDEPVTADWDMVQAATPSTNTRSLLDPYVAELEQHGLDPRIRNALIKYHTFEPCPLAPTPYLQDCLGQQSVKRYTCNANRHPLDDDIVAFENPHYYFVRDGTQMTCANVASGTGIIKAFFPGFDDVKQAAQTCSTKSHLAAKHRPSYKYFRCETPEHILSVWEENRNAGTRLHLCIEQFLNQEPYEVDECNQKPWKQFWTLHQKHFHKYTPFRTEWAIFDPETRVAGKIDYLAYDPATGTYVIIDWKRSERISDRSFAAFAKKEPEYGFGPCSDLENCNYITYSLQQNLYKYILERNYGIRVSQMFLVQMHPTINDTDKDGDPVPVLYMVPNFQHYIVKMLACRKFLLQQVQK